MFGKAMKNRRDEVKLAFIPHSDVEKNIKR